MLYSNMVLNLDPPLSLPTKGFSLWTNKQVNFSFFKQTLSTESTMHAFTFWTTQSSLRSRKKKGRSKIKAIHIKVPSHILLNLQLPRLLLHGAPVVNALLFYTQNRRFLLF